MAEKTQSSVVHEVAAALAREPRVGLAARPIRIGLDHGDLVLEGEVEDVAAKKLALERAACIRGVDRILDRLHVARSVEVPDREILQRVCGELRREPALEPYRVLPRRLGLGEEPHLLEGTPGEIAVSVEDGVVTLDGTVTALRHKRLAGTLAWWVLGVRDVINGLGVESPAHDSDREVVIAVRAALERDPWVRDASEIQVAADHSVVWLRGRVHTREEARHAERDAWCIFAVDRVENELAIELVRSGDRSGADARLGTRSVGQSQSPGNLCELGLRSWFLTERKPPCPVGWCSPPSS